MKMKEENDRQKKVTVSRDRQKGLSKIKRNRAGRGGDDAQHVEDRKREHENTRTGRRS